MAQPAALFSISFQLSFTAVFSIVYGFDRMQPLRPGAPPQGQARAVRIKHGVFVFCGVSLIATWGTLPLGMYYFNIVSLIGLPANCVAVPLMGYLVVVAGLIGTLFAPLSVAAAVACYQISGFVLSKTIAFLEILAGLPFAAVRTITPSELELTLFYLLSGAAFYLATDRDQTAAPSSDETSSRKMEDTRRVWRLKERIARAIRPASFPRKAALGLLVLGSVGGFVDAGYWLYQRFGRQDLRATLLDVGQGSAVLVEFPGGETALVDGGGFADMAAFDVGASVVAPFLWRRKIASIDTLILTHPDSDHLNGLVFIAANFNVKRLWTNGELSSLAGYNRLMSTARERGIAVPKFSDIPRSTSVRQAQLDVLYPPVDFQERAAEDHWRRDENNNSLVTRVSLGEVSVLIPGDIMLPAERELVAGSGGALKSNVLIAPHHGSRSSSSEEFLRMVAPQATFISCANRPGSRLPHPLVLERYERHGIRVYRTDRDGALQLVTDGRNLTISSWLMTDR
jgi:competence protein ComEC